MNEQTYIALINNLPAILIALSTLIAVIIGQKKNSKKIEELHVAVNSRLTELLKQTALASEAKGKADEQERIK